MNDLKKWFEKLYGSNENVINYQKNRYEELLKKYENHYDKNDDPNFFSAPGRTELSGNHTDHNGGKVIAASINLDSIACVARQESYVEIYSEGFNEKIYVDLKHLAPVNEEKESSTALIRGIAAAFVKRGYNIGGFRGVITSDVLVGSGLSSSASFEVLIGTIFNHFYNDNKIPLPVIARIGQYAENEYFGKPCGLMDQLACAVGSVVAIDFKGNEEPQIEKINFDLSTHNFKLLVVNTGGSHHNLTEDYAAIPREMKQVAGYFGKEICSQVEFDIFEKNIPKLYGEVSNRALLRALHFFNENKRVTDQAEALKNNRFEKFLRLVNESGNSSFKYLQNIYTPQDVDEQPLSVALAVTENFISKKDKGACRVHGGGFAGTIQVFLHEDNVNEYKELIEPIFGKGSVNILDIRNIGATALV